MRAWFLPLILVLGIASPALGQDFDPKRIYQKASKAVVLIAAFDRGEKIGSSGTGSIIQADGLVLTNAHVVVNKETNRPYDLIRVFLKPDRVTGNIKSDTARKFKATLVNYSNSLDLAVLRIEKSRFSTPLPHLKFSDLAETSIGDPVLAIGHPEQGGLWTLTTGTISSLIENFGNVPGKDVFQTETSINRGNSGGPLIDRHGLMVGINSMIAREGEGGVTITDINFSVKSTVAVRWMNSVGYSYNYANPQPAPADNTPTDNAGIVPVPKQEPEPSEIKPEPKPPEEPKILTEIRPYKEQDLVQQIEDEMEDMMEEMKGKIRSR